MTASRSSCSRQQFERKHLRERMSKKAMRQRLAALSFMEKVKILEKLRERSLLLAASPLRRKISKEREDRKAQRAFMKASGEAKFLFDDASGVHKQLEQMPVDTMGIIGYKRNIGPSLNGSELIPESRGSKNGGSGFTLRSLC